MKPNFIFRFIFIINACFPLLAIAQTTQSTRKLVPSTLSGQVTNPAGQPLAGATVTIYDIHRGVFADSSGRYVIPSLAPGRYTIEVSFTGYGNLVQTIAVTDVTIHNFTLTPAVAEGENVTVTGVSTATSTRRSPQTVDVIRRSQLLDGSATNIIDALSKTPGVMSVSTGPAVSKPYIRGLGANRIVTVNDGVRQEGQQWGDEHGIEIDDYSVQRVEILKGPASLIYGSDALAGVINIQTLVPAPEGTLRGEILGEYQSNSRLRGFYGNLAGTSNGLSWGAFGSFKAAGDYKNAYDGHVFNSRFYNHTFGGMLGYSGTWGHSYLMATSFNQNLGIVEGDRDETTGDFLKIIPGGSEVPVTEDDFHRTKMQVPYQSIRHFKLTSENSFNLGHNRLDFVTGYQRNQRREHGDPDAPGEPEGWFDLHTLTYALRLNLPYRANWKTSFGVTGMGQQNMNRAEEVVIPEYGLFDIGGYLFTQYNREKLTLSGGLRYDHRAIDSKAHFENSDLKFDAFRKNFSNISGSAGLSYLVNQAVTLKLNVARGFRAPSLPELASNGAHEGTNRYEVGDRNLKSETSLQGDLGLEINSMHVTFDVNGFYNHLQNFIFYRKMLNMSGGDSLLVDPDGDELTVFQFNQHSANLYGVEATLDIHPHPLDWLHFENRFSYTRAKFTAEVDGSRNVPLIPAARLLSNVRGNFRPQGKSIRNLYLGFEADFNAMQRDAFTGFDTETPTAGYALMNIYAGADITGRKGNTLFSVHFSAMNLSDVAYQSHLSRLKYTAINNVTGRQGVFNMGRNFGIKINVPLELEN